MNPEFPSRAEIAWALDPRNLHLMVLPTEDCNFRCQYCYEDHVPGRMAPAVVEGIKKLIDRRLGDLKGLGLSWFGGEPLLARQIVFELCEFVQQRCRQHGVERLPGEMVTNGYLLTPSVMARLAAADQRYFHISLDGLGATHDELRPLASGRGTFDRIWRNLVDLRAGNLDFVITLRVHYGMADHAATEALCGRINETFAGDVRFRVLLQRIANLGGANADQLKPIPVVEARQRGRQLTGLMPAIDVANVDTAEDGICYAAQPNHLLIRPDGRVAKCAVNLRDERNTVGQLDGDGRLRIDRSRLQPWLRGFDNLDAEMLTCPYGGVAATPLPEVQPLRFVAPAAAGLAGAR